MSTGDGKRKTTCDEDQNPIDEENGRRPKTTEHVCMPNVHEIIQNFREKNQLDQRNEEWNRMGRETIDLPFPMGSLTKR